MDKKGNMIISLIESGVNSVPDIAAATKMTRTAVSSRLSRMLKKGTITSLPKMHGRGSGRWARYKLVTSPVREPEQLTLHDRATPHDVTEETWRAVEEAVVQNLRRLPHRMFTRPDGIIIFHFEAITITAKKKNWAASVAEGPTSEKLL